MAIALTTQCPIAARSIGNKSIAAGVTENELAEVVHVAASRAGGAITHGTHRFADLGVRTTLHFGNTFVTTCCEHSVQYVQHAPHSYVN